MSPLLSAALDRLCERLTSSDAEGYLLNPDGSCPRHDYGDSARAVTRQYYARNIAALRDVAAAILSEGPPVGTFEGLGARVDRWLARRGGR